MSDGHLTNNVADFFMDKVMKNRKSLEELQFTCQCLPDGELSPKLFSVIELTTD